MRTIGSDSLTRLIRFSGALAAILAGASAGFAQATPHGGQFQVNSFTPNSQQRPAAAFDAQGRLVAVWKSFGEIGDPDSSVQGQRYSAAGLAQGAQFQVNSSTGDYQGQPSVARFSNGEFVVVWESSSSTGSDLSLQSIQGQRFAADGSPLGAEFQINTFTTAEQRAPRVATGGANEFVVVWQSYGSGGNDTSGYSIQGQRFSATGVPQGGEFQVNAFTTDNQQRPGVAVDLSGNFWVVFETSAAAGGDPDGSIQARYYYASGVPNEPQELILNASVIGAQRDPRVAAGNDGLFLAVWESFDSAGTDADLSIQGYYLNAIGEPLGDEFQINTYTTGLQTQPAVAAYGNSGFIVSWESQTASAPDPTSNIRAARPGLGSDFQVNTLTAGAQRYSAVTADPHGNFVVLWESAGSVGTDNAETSIQGQLYDALFRDGFESNDTGRWSSAVP